MKPKLLVLELWALGDLALAAPFLQAASDRYDVSLLAKPMARELGEAFWPKVRLVEFSFPWTAFRHKYALHSWPWRELTRVVCQLRSEHFDWAVSARWDPRDHFLMALTGARQRIGFSRLGSRMLLSSSLPSPGMAAHRYEYWRRVGECLGLNMPAERPCPVTSASGGSIVIHVGARQKTRVWPLERYAKLVELLRQMGGDVRILCDPDQLAWWQSKGETPRVPDSLPGLIQQLRGASLFVGNDSGPGHLAALLGVPTFTIFGNQIAARFSPLNQMSYWVEGHECAYKPCYDSCRFAEPHCLWKVSVDEVWRQLEPLAVQRLKSV